MRKKWYIGILVGGLILAALWAVKNPSLGFSTGRCIVTDDGRSCLILIGNDPVSMINRSWNADLFAELRTGDEIRILHDGILETYPGRTGVYLCQRIREGSPKDIPGEVLESLLELGWKVSGGHGP